MIFNTKEHNREMERVRTEYKRRRVKRLQCDTCIEERTCSKSAAGEERENHSEEQEKIEKPYRSKPYMSEEITCIKAPGEEEKRHTTENLQRIETPC